MTGKCRLKIVETELLCMVWIQIWVSKIFLTSTDVWCSGWHSALCLGPGFEFHS